MARTERLVVRVDPETAAAVRGMVGRYGSANAFVNVAILEKLDRGLQEERQQRRLATRPREERRAER